MRRLDGGRRTFSPSSTTSSSSSSSSSECDAAADLRTPCACVTGAGAGRGGGEGGAPAAATVDVCSREMHGWAKQITTHHEKSLCTHIRQRGRCSCCRRSTTEPLQFLNIVNECQSVTQWLHTDTQQSLFCQLTQGTDGDQAVLLEEVIVVKEVGLL